MNIDKIHNKWDTLENESFNLKEYYHKRVQISIWINPQYPLALLNNYLDIHLIESFDCSYIIKHYKI